MSRAFLVWVGLLCAAPAFAHDAPYSFLDLRLHPTTLEGALTAHVFDLAHELGMSEPDSLLDSTRAALLAPRLASILGPRLHLSADGEPLRLHFAGAAIEKARQGVTLRFTAAFAHRPGTLDLEARLFPYDPQHETYVNVYEGDSLSLQTLLDRKQDRARLYTGTRQGRLAVFGTFLVAGVQHIFTGPDHVLFVIALLLLGGGITRLLKVVTAFTIAHSITLALATLRIVDPPARVIEPMIALSIVLVGFDNLRAKPGKDHRATLAFLFGLVHGFGFASVLREFGLPQSAVGWSLFSFNLGVEVGQATIVMSVAPLLGLLRGRSPRLATQVVRYGSSAVVLAGAYWLGERLLLATR
jgi:hydrogenase/urease accessory protein HupE